MSFVATDLKGLLTLNIKSRHDGYLDQYNRIFMVKLLMVATIVMGLSWYGDSINCIIPGDHEIDGGFVAQTCWIQGVYVYKELKDRIDEVAYFGIPKDITYDGFLKGSETNALCQLQPKLQDKREDCEPMNKTFYLQYQYFPFLVATFAILFYLPYIAFRAANSDLISLKNNVKSDDVDPEAIAKHYFSKSSNPQRSNIYRIVFNILIKILYLVANLICFLGLDGLLNGEFIGYGNRWIEWTKLENTIQYDYMGMRDHPKPGNSLLPPFGYCEVHASAKDIKDSYANKHKFVCELSQNVLYQYTLVVLWFALIVGIIVSCIGIIVLFVHYAIGIFGFKAQGPTGKRIFKMLSFRELEYLEFIRKRDIALYGEVLDKLKDIKLGDAPYPPHGDAIPLVQPKSAYNDKPGYQL